MLNYATCPQVDPGTGHGVIRRYVMLGAVCGRACAGGVPYAVLSLVLADPLRAARQCHRRITGTQASGPGLCSHSINEDLNRFGVELFIFVTGRNRVSAEQLC